MFLGVSSDVATKPWKVSQLGTFFRFTFSGLVAAHGPEKCDCHLGILKSLIPIGDNLGPHVLSVLLASR